MLLSSLKMIYLDRQGHPDFLFNIKLYNKFVTVS